MESVSVLGGRSEESFKSYFFKFFLDLWLYCVIFDLRRIEKNRSSSGCHCISRGCRWNHGSVTYAYPENEPALYCLLVWTQLDGGFLNDSAVTHSKQLKISLTSRFDVMLLQFICLMSERRSRRERMRWGGGEPPTQITSDSIGSSFKLYKKHFPMRRK